MKRKILAMVVAGAVLLSSGAVFAASTLNKWISKDGSFIEQVNYPIYVNGEKLNMIDPITGKSQVVLGHNGRTYVPLRKVAEAVGADSNSMWDASDPKNPTVQINTPEHSLPTDYVQINIFPNGQNVQTAITSNTTIENEAKRICKGIKSKDAKAQAIYNYVKNRLTYFDTGAVGAIPAFYNERGICYDYACLYAAMCDAVGLNVRIVGGLALTSEESIYDYPTNHAWNEVQGDNGTWFAVDATFGDTGNDTLGWKFQEKDMETQELYINDRLPTWLFCEFENY